MQACPASACGQACSSIARACCALCSSAMFLRICISTVFWTEAVRVHSRDSPSVAKGRSERVRTTYGRATAALSSSLSLCSAPSHSAYHNQARLLVLTTSSLLVHCSFSFWTRGVAYKRGPSLTAQKRSVRVDRLGSEGTRRRRPAAQRVPELTDISHRHPAITLLAIPISLSPSTRIPCPARPPA